MISFRRPLGLFLQGGGVLGAWQAGALEVLMGAGVTFDAVMGYSIGAVNGYALAFGRFEESLSRWQALDGGVLRLRPRFDPPTLFSDDPLYALFEPARDDAAARAELKTDFTVISACPAAGAPVNARFTPGGRGGWDGPFIAHAVASCSIPLVFPPVDIDYRGHRLRLIDGGIPMAAPLDMTPLMNCADVLILEMVRADELSRRPWTPWGRLDHYGRATGRKLVDDGVASLLKASPSARVYRLEPSRRLEPLVLDFRAGAARPLVARGGEDARVFLADAESRRAK